MYSVKTVNCKVLRTEQSQNISARVVICWCQWRTSERLPFHSGLVCCRYRNTGVIDNIISMCIPFRWAYWNVVHTASLAKLRSVCGSGLWMWLTLYLICFITSAQNAFMPVCWGLPLVSCSKCSLRTEWVLRVFSCSYGLCNGAPPCTID